MTPLLELATVAVLAGALMAASFLIALALSDSKIRMMTTLMNQERERREKAEIETSLSTRIPELQKAMETTQSTLDALDTTVGRLVTAMQLGGHLSRGGSEAPMAPGEMTARFGDRRPPQSEPTRRSLPEAAAPI